jgi:hypothetical protein
MLRYTSTLKAEYSEELERLMFFNPGQQDALAAIMNSLETFGSPSVYTDNGVLRVKVEKLNEVQTLYAMDDDTLIGVLVYSRVMLDCLSVLHIAVNEEYSAHGKQAKSMLVMRMLELLRNNARRIKGVETIRLMCNNNQVRELSV